MIFLVLSVILTISTVSATDVSNSTLSLDKSIQTQTNDIPSQIDTIETPTYINDKVVETDSTSNSKFTSKKSDIESTYNDNISNEYKSTNTTSNNQITSLNSINKQSINTSKYKYSNKTMKTAEESTNITEENISDVATNKSNITIIMDSVESHPYSNIVLNAVVKTTDGVELNNSAPVVFKVNGVTIGKSNVVDGVASLNFTIPKWGAKNYTVLCKVGETNTTLSNTAESTLTITQNDVSVTMDSYTANVGSIIELKAYVTYLNGTGLDKAPAVFKVNGVTIGKSNVVDGVASLNFTVPTWSARNYTILCKIGKTSYSNYNETTGKLTVMMGKSSINITDLFFTKTNKNVTFTTKITTSNGIFVKSGKVAFKINGKTIGVVKVNNGVAKLIYTASNLSTRTYNVSVVYSGNSYSERANATSKLRVQSLLSKYTYSQVLKKAYDTKVFIEKYKKLPNFVTFGDDYVSTTDFLYLLCQVYSSNSSYYRGYFPTQEVTTKTSKNNINIYKNEYILLAENIIDCYANNGRAPHNIITESNVTMNFDDALYFYTRAVAYIYNHGEYSNYGTLIKLSTISSSSSSTTADISTNTVSTDYKKYLVVSKNCQVNSTYIRNQLNNAIKGVNGTYNQAVAIFNYVNKHTDYLYYSNTRYGATGTLQRGYGNCVDMAHAVIALMRTANIPARYNHATCTFRSGLVTGHVWAEVYVNGKWYRCDATSSSNTFGNIVNWRKCGTIKTYISLPF